MKMDHRQFSCKMELMNGFSRGATWVNVKHVGPFENVESILFLRQEEACGAVFGRDARKVIKGAQICHGQLTAKEGINLLKKRCR